MKKKVVIGTYGSVVDSGLGPKRWDKWRPTVSVCQHEDLLVDRFELLYQRKFRKFVNQIVEDIRSVSPETKVVTRPIEFRDPWDFEDVYGALHDFSRNYKFDTDNEEYLIHVTTGTHVFQICLFLLTESHHLPGKLIQTSPPKSRDSMDPGSYTIIDLDLSKYDKLASRFQKEASDDISFLKSGIETRNKNFNQLIERIEQVATNSHRPLLIMGPTGAGKSQLARRIFDLKKQWRQLSGKFIEVNCATLRGDMAMSTLFGHVRGAFSGAQSDRRGLLKEADEGLLFLDEVAELGLDEQAMLLRALEEKSFLPLGSDTEVQSDFQLICGTNKDLASEVDNGRFRDDLLSRINLWTFQLPGLSERVEDIEPNLYYELDQFEHTGGMRVSFNKEAMKRFLSFATSSEARWKANFRDLNGAVTRMATLASGGRITVENVEEEIGRLSYAWRTDTTLSDDGEVLSEIIPAQQLSDLDPFDRVQLAYVVKICRKSRSLSEAGRKLFAISRIQKKNRNDADRLRKYLSRFKLTWTDIAR